MKFEFKLYEIDTKSKIWEQIIKNNPGQPNDFIIVGEEDKCYKAHHLSEKGIVLIPGIDICKFCLRIPKDVLKPQGEGRYFSELIELDIPKEYLTMDIAEDIQRLNQI